MKWLLKLFKLFFYLAIAGITVAVIAIGGVYLHFKSDLPSIENLKQVQLQVPLRVYSADNKLTAQFGEKRRLPVSYSELPPSLIQAFLAAEDHYFFSHPGIDPIGLARAAISLAATGERRQGGSTITMQVARNFYLSRKRTYTRKIREIFLALHIEQALSKEEILELYLNKIYLGHRAYGVGAAAQVYYGKTLDELTLAQIAMIAGLPKAPSKYNPITNPERALQRRDYVLNGMLNLGHITQEEATEALGAPVTASLHRAKLELEAPYVAEMVRKYMVDRYGQEAYTSGYNVYTTIDSELQSTATMALRNALEAYDKRHGWRGAETRFEPLPENPDDLQKLNSGQSMVGNLRPGIVISTGEKSAEVFVDIDTRVQLDWPEMEWARAYQTENRRGPKPATASEILQPGDLVRLKLTVDEEGNSRWALAQIPAVSGAFSAIDPNDGSILALTGGYDFYYSKFNRATQAMRQPGSGFKAFIYSAALEAGYTAASIINDAPVVTEDVSLEGAWRPENYSGKFFGPTRLRMALTKSRNLISIRLLRAMGLNHALKHIEQFGFSQEQLPHNLSLALGSGEVSPLQMSRGYAVLANGGYLIEPFFIQSISNSHGETIFEAHPITVCSDCDEQPALLEEEFDTSAADAVDLKPMEEPAAPDTIALPQAPRVISPENRFIMYSMMQDVITRGTATKAKALKRNDLAGKTGTSNDQRDAWFNGYNQSIVANVWVGFDNNSKLGRGEVGGRAALPAWIDFMKVALEKFPDEPPVMPEGMITMRIDAKTGLPATADSRETLFEIFRPGFAPGEIAAPGNGEEIDSPVAVPQSQQAAKKPRPIAEDIF